MNKLNNLHKKISTCTNCKLHKTRTNTVPGEGSSTADIMFIGEGPGANEDKNGVPFCGAAGKVLDEMLGKIKLERKDVFVGNVVKCRPPGNRDPEKDEVEACWPYLEEQISIIKPKLFVLLGRHAMERFVTGKKISEVRGVLLRQPVSEGNEEHRYYFPVFHPAAALYNGSLRSVLEKDFKKIPGILKKIEIGEI